MHCRPSFQQKRQDLPSSRKRRGGAEQVGGGIICTMSVVFPTFSSYSITARCLYNCSEDGCIEINNDLTNLLAVISNFFQALIFFQIITLTFPVFPMPNNFLFCGHKVILYFGARWSCFKYDFSEKFLTDRMTCSHAFCTRGLVIITTHTIYNNPTDARKTLTSIYRIISIPLYQTEIKTHIRMGGGGGH